MHYGTLAHALITQAAAGSYIDRAASAHTFAAASEQAAEFRPPKRDLVDLTLLYLVDLLALAAVPWFSILLLGRIPVLFYFSFEVLFLFTPAIVFFSVIFFPYNLQVLFLLFGSDRFLLRWLDKAVVWGIERLVSNGMLLTEMLNLFLPAFFILAVFIEDPRYIGFYLITGLLMNASFCYLWERTRFASVYAIRYVDPSWNKVSGGKPLYPGIAYRVGKREYDYGAEQSANQQKSVDTASD